MIETNRHILVANKLLVAMSGLTRWTKRADHYRYEQHHYNIPACFTAFKWTKSRIRHMLSILAYADDQGKIEFIGTEWSYDGRPSLPRSDLNPIDGLP